MLCSTVFKKLRRCSVYSSGERGHIENPWRLKCNKEVGDMQNRLQSTLAEYN